MVETSLGFATLGFALG